MKITDNLINRFGADKLLHLAFGGWITAIFSALGWLGIGFSTIGVIVLSFVKEYKCDKVVDIKDVLAAVIGCAITWICYFVLILI